jgi:SAM-dependent methyltransferase/uncharacterized protein YbaR (Trm112 family)
MRPDTLDLLRCPYCGGRLAIDRSLPSRREGDIVVEATLACYCCVFPVIEGIPVLHLEPEAKRARQQLGRGDAAGARRTMLRLDEAQAGRFEAAAGRPRPSYREMVEALGPGFEGGYFLYRFSDPTYIVADAVVRSVAAAALTRTRRAIDLCGGSGHLTRSLLPQPNGGSPTDREVVLADLHFAKLWLARRFTAPGCDAICCDANSPLPFADGAFDFAVCSDAFHYVWTKRLFASEMMRLVGPAGVVAITHAHNALQWNPSAGMPLPPEAYRDLFAPLAPRLYGERGLLAAVLSGGGVDLSRPDAGEAIAADPALTIVACRRGEVFRHLALPIRPRGELRVNPLYAVEVEHDRVRLRLHFPSPDYEEEYGACRAYLPAEVSIDRAAFDALPSGRLAPALEDLARRWVILDLPKDYY